MNEKMKDELREVLNQVLDERDRLDHETHRGHHDWIQRQMEQDALRRERWDTFKKSAIGAIAVAATGMAIKILAFIGGLILASSHNGGVK